MESVRQIEHLGYQLAGYAMEPIRQYSWVALRAFGAPSFEDLSSKKGSVFTNVPPLENLNVFRDKIAIEPFSSSSPYLSTKVRETALQAFLAGLVLAIPLIGSGIISLPYLTHGVRLLFTTGILGQTLHAAIVHVSSRKFTELSGNHPTPQMESCKSIASWNVGLVSVFAPLNVGTWESIVSFHLFKKILNMGGVKSEGSRLEKQREILRELRTEIICFQEFFDPLQGKALHLEVDDLYPHGYVDIGAHVWKGSSGLAVFSKDPLKNFSVFEFNVPSQGLHLGINAKYITFDTDINGQSTRVFATHLNCGNYPEVRRKQLEEIKAHMDQSDIDNCLLVGDLNFDLNDSQAVDTQFFNEHFNNLLPPSYTCSNALKFKHSLEKEILLERIDSIASYKPLEPTNSLIRLDSMTLNVSDHLPLALYF